MKPSEIKQLQNACLAMSELKSQLIEELPHFGHQSLFFENDEITTGQLNNKTEIKINLLTGQLLYFHNEEGHLIDSMKVTFQEECAKIVTKYNLKRRNNIFISH